MIATLVNMDPSPRRDEPPPRGLLLLSAAWIALSVLVAFGTRPPLLPLAATYSPAVRLSLIVLLGGILIAYPLLRLTQPVTSRPMRRAILDLAVLLGAIHAYLWPVRLATQWSLERTAAIDLLLCGAALAAVGLVLLGTRREHGRTAWMLLVLALTAGPIVAGPLLAAIAGASWLRDGSLGDGSPGDGWLDVGSIAPALPFVALERLASSTTVPLGADEWRLALVPTIAGVVLLAIAMAIAAGTRRTPPGTRASMGHG